MSSVSYPLHQLHRRPRQRFSFEQALLSIFIGLLIFGASLFLYFLGTQVWYAGRIFPGVRVAGVDVGGLRPQEAAQRISEAIAYPHQGKILFRDGDRVWVATPSELGLNLDSQASARSAYQVGRTGWLPGRLQSQLFAWYSGQNLPPNLVFDQRVAYAYLTSLAKEVDKPTVEASVELKGTDVVVLPGQVGRSVNIQKSLVLVSLQLQTMRDGVLNLFIDESAPVILDASKQAELARAMLSQPLTLSLPPEDANQAGPWKIEPPVLASMLAFERVQSGNSAQYEVRLDGDSLRTYLDGLAPSLTRAPQNARLTFNDEAHQLEVIQPAVIGRELNVDGSVQDIQQKLYAGQHSIPLTITYSDPPVTDKSTGDQLGIRELVHSETSYFYGSSSSRVQNIQTAASKFHGLLVAPGETFSMASALGDITLDNGYAEALIIIGNQTLKGVGGGVCQVSTTLFRTAFFAGFPIAERHAHAYRVYYYEKVAGNRINPDLAGLDATVFVPLVDFKFTNDTPYWLLMETYVNPTASSITWKFYSTSDGRRVDWNTTGPTNIISAPPAIYRENTDLPSGTIKHVDYAADGADVTVNRTVYRNDAVYLQDTIYTHYEAWADAFEYGPGTEITPDSSNN
jgi:vancomycin resistance protein YoaR